MHQLEISSFICYNILPLFYYSYFAILKFGHLIVTRTYHILLAAHCSIRLLLTFCFSQIGWLSAVHYVYHLYNNL